MENYQTKNLRVLSHVIAGYMLLALLWWGILLTKQSKQLFETSMELIREREQNSGLDYSIEREEVSKKHRGQRLMIVGEGSVFVIALLIGIWFINRGYTREIEAIRQKRNFLLAITHELKSPLASIGLILETFQKRILQRDQQQKLLDHALKETGRLSDLIENLLLSARLEKSYQLNLVQVDIHVILKRIIGDIQKRFPKTTITMQFSDSNMIGKYDQTGLHSTFYNLIENAAKYSPQTSEISIQTTQEEKSYRIEIRDQGPGIAEEEKRKIFDQFYRSGQEETRNTQGTGIGLFIVHKMVEFHHGKIEVFDNKPKGSIFRITLPNDLK
ncbi:MAG: GHKL domain-containing protein [Saprospiraceae bacterium]|nr:GHKL domain-containing protein [Saprospiraceae bacterium]